MATQMISRRTESEIMHQLTQLYQRRASLIKEMIVISRAGGRFSPAYPVHQEALDITQARIHALEWVTGGMPTIYG